MNYTNHHYGALRELHLSRCYKIIGFLLVHIAAYGLFTNLLPEFSAVVGIAGLALYRGAHRQMVAARQLLLDSVNTNRLIA